MSTPDKPDPARAWMFVQKLLDDEEIERIERLSDEELDLELRAHGRDPARLPSAEELLAKAAAHASRRVAAIARETDDRPADDARRQTGPERAETLRDDAARTDAGTDKKTPGQ